MPESLRELSSEIFRQVQITIAAIVKVVLPLARKLFNGTQPPFAASTPIFRI
jgi:hypothetical protein